MQHLVDCMTIFGIEKESGFKPKNKDLQGCSDSNTTVWKRNLDCLLLACKQTEPFPHCEPQELLNIKWQDKIPDTEVLTKAGLPSIHSISHKGSATVVCSFWSVCQIYDCPNNCFMGKRLGSTLRKICLKLCCKHLI